jgi:hypothetical protein
LKDFQIKIVLRFESYVNGKLIVPLLAVGFTKMISAFLSTFDMASLYLGKWIIEEERISRKNSL